jgi:flagellar basal-body rod protein FlgG
MSLAGVLSRRKVTVYRLGGASLSTKGIFTALSGAIAQNNKLDTVANNIANANTAGYKRDEQVFREYLTANEKPPEVIQVPKVPASIDSFYDTQGADRGYVETAGTYTDFSQGQMIQTGSSLDFGLEGEGFYEVLTPQGVRLTRAASLSIDNDGQLVTKSGYPILKAGAAGGDPQARVFKVNGARITSSYAGELFQAGESLGKLSVVNVGNIDALQKIGSSLFALKPNYNATITPAPEYKVHQGFVEGSNVNIVKEMTDMIAATRTFEANQKSIQAFDKMDEKLNNEVPKTRG